MEMTFTIVGVFPLTKTLKFQKIRQKIRRTVNDIGDRDGLH